MVNGSEISDPEAISNAFNEYFTEIGPNLAALIPTNTSSAVDNINRNNLVFELHEVSTIQISRLVDKLSICKASGLDNISVRLLKSSAPTIIPSLTYIINSVICKGIIPADWKSARVSAIYKNDSKLDLNNYRPISVLPVIAKVFEKVVFDQTYNFLNDNDLLSKEQSGFRHLHSTLTAMLDATDQWYTNMDNGLINAILFVDLKKAFDTIDHEILLGILNRYGFSNQTVELFRNYLSGRTQITVINNVSSGSCEITCGVPQGSILGPLLFLLYINDLPKCQLVSNGRLFADDTNLTYADNDLNKITSVLNDDLKILQNWLNMNKLSLNVMKTKYMFVASRQRLSNIPEQLDISISGIEIKRVKSFKCLGLELDEGLTWESHVSAIISKVSKVIGVLRRLKSLLPLSALVLIYNSLIQPHFDYCSVIWDNLAGGLGQKLQRMQNRAARIITGSDYYTRSSEILGSLN